MVKKKDSTPATPEKPIEESNVITQIHSFFVHEKFRKILGLIFIFFGVIAAIAIVSYFSTWHEDQDEVFQFSWGLLLQSEAVILNSMGRLGAILSHEFIFNGFGVASLIIPYLSIISGCNLLLSRSRRKLIYNIAIGIPLMFMIATLLATFMGNTNFSWGGGIGMIISQWITSFIGFMGTMISLGFVILSTAIVFFNININDIGKWFKKKIVTSNTLINNPTANNTNDIPNNIDKDNGKIDEPEDDPFNEGYKDFEDDGFVITTRPSLNEVLAQDNIKSDKIDFSKSSFPKLPVRKISTVENGLELEPINDIDLNQSMVLQSKASTLKSYEASDLVLDIETQDSANTLFSKHAADQLTAHTNADDSFFPYDPTLDLSDYRYPTLDLLMDYKNEKGSIDKEELQRNSDQIIATLNNYNIEISKIKATVGPSVTLYEIVPAPGIRISKIKNLEDDIALNLAALGIRIIAPIPGRGTIGIEVPNLIKETVSMRSILSSPQFMNSTSELPIGMGKTISNEIFVFDLTKMPHLLMAGATGQGKSVGLNAVLASLLYKKHPSQLKLVLIDPKKVELSLYKMIEKHFLAKLPGESDAIITDTKKVISTLNSLCIEMDERYELLKSAGVRNIIEYNKKFVERKLNPSTGHRFMPYIVLVVDEFADLIMTAGKEIEMPLARLAQLARAIGIHLIIATQRPSVNIITGIIKANFPGRIAFRVSSKIDSRTILDVGGAEQLIGKGDMLVTHGNELIRVQCAFLDLDEVESLTEFISKQRAYAEAYQLPEYIEEGEISDRESFDPSERDSMFADAARVIVASQQGSTSMIQRRLKLGYNRAGRIMDQLEAAQIVGPNEGSKAREVLIKTMEELEQFLNNMI